MKAIVYQGPNKKEFIDRPKPKIEAPTDVIVNVKKTTICGTDLHILKGDVDAVKPGTILGHEGTGIVEEVGSAVQNFKKGDHVLISCVSSCGTCEYCKKQLYAHCTTGGWILGHLIDGTQAEYVRIPYGDNSLYPIPPDVDEEGMVMLSDILPTGLEIGVLSGKVQPGHTVAIVGAGPVGFSALLAAQFYSPSKIIMVDIDQERLEKSREFGATDIVNSKGSNAIEAIKEIVGPEGVDVAMEAVGIPATFDICQRILKPGGYLANIGVHGKPVELQLQDLWIRNVTITTGLVSTSSTPMLIKNVQSKKLEPKKMVTHRFKFDEFLKAYDVFANASKEKALKVIISND